MISKRKKGFGAYEMLTICVMLLIIIVVALAYVFKTDYTEKYKVMRYNAKMLGLSVSNLYLEDDSKKLYYLQELIDSKLYSDVKNPFQGDKFCDTYLSKVEIKDNDKKFVTLECGNYLIYNQNTIDEEYDIYQASEWSSKKHKNDNQETVFYNYQVDGQDVFEEWLEKDIFLYEYNKKNGTEYLDITEIPEDVSIQEKTMYRYIKKVSD